MKSGQRSWRVYIAYCPTKRNVSKGKDPSESQPFEFEKSVTAGPPFDKGQKSEI
jgi:hypothetical protein